MAAMADPAIALKLFEQAFEAGQIPVERGRLDRDLLFAPDQINGKSRLNYMRAEEKRLSVLVMFAQNGMVEGHPCFNIGYAVRADRQGQGLAKSTLVAALAELTNGLAGAGLPAIYVEAVISADNLASQQVAKAIFDAPPKAITDSESGLPALLYVRKIELAKNFGNSR